MGRHRLDFATRRDQFDEALEICRRLWTEPVVGHHGEPFDFGLVMFEPKAAQRPTPPTSIGGDSLPAPRRTCRGRLAPDETPLEQLPAALTNIAHQRSQTGREGA